MTHTKLYGAIFVVLFVSATVQVLVEAAGIAYWTAFGIILALSVIKAGIVAAYYMHLRWEQYSLTYVFLTGLLAAIALTVAASYSIT